MSGVFREPIDAARLKQEALSCGADLVGIADGEQMNLHPPDPAKPMRPIDITEYDWRRVIVIAKHLSNGAARIPEWGSRTKFYNDELSLTLIEEASLELVCWLESLGYPAIALPPTHTDPWRYQGDPGAPMSPLLSLPHAAVEAGLGTLGLNGQLLTPQYGPRVVLCAVLCSAEVECDRPMSAGLCRGPECGRCVSACPADAGRHWARDWRACDEYRSPYGFARLTGHIDRILAESDPAGRKALLRTETMFNLWQSILRGAGAITGCRRCADVCPVGADYPEQLRDALGVIAEDTPAKAGRLAAMVRAEAAGSLPQSWEDQRRWIGTLDYLAPEAGFRGGGTGRT